PASTSPRPPRATPLQPLCPSPTLFRSGGRGGSGGAGDGGQGGQGGAGGGARSDEHTSVLRSH
ncbi:hypothetical protein GQD96_20895, partial [Mycobacterium tuberculosis]|nr:hypothetical protein [Mycobacterium tuberculosis]